MPTSVNISGVTTADQIRSVIADTSVRYDLAQSLSEPQKIQVRENIGVVESLFLSSTLSSGNTTQAPNVDIVYNALLAKAPVESPVFTLRAETPNLRINGPAGTNRPVVFRTAGVTRFEWNLTNEAETGANAGSNLWLNAFADNGAYLDAVLRINRASLVLNFVYSPTVPNVTIGDSSTKAANTAFVADGLALKANLASPTFTGTPAAPTATAGTNTTQIATTAFVTAALSGYAPLAAPAFTGVPTAPTAALNTNTTQIATTAFVRAAVLSAGAIYDMGFNGVPLDGVSSAVSSLNTLINSVSTAGGGVIRAEGGKVLIDSTVQLKQNVTIDFGGATLVCPKLSSGAHFYCDTNANNIKVGNAKVDGRQSTYTAPLVASAMFQITNGLNCEFHDLFFFDCPQVAAAFSLSTHCRLTDINLLNCGSFNLVTLDDNDARQGVVLFNTSGSPGYGNRVRRIKGRQVGLDLVSADNQQFVKIIDIDGEGFIGRPNTTVPGAAPVYCAALDNFEISSVTGKTVSGHVVDVINSRRGLISNVMGMDVDSSCVGLFGVDGGTSEDVVIDKVVSINAGMDATALNRDCVSLVTSGANSAVKNVTVRGLVGIGSGSDTQYGVRAAKTGTTTGAVLSNLRLMADFNLTNMDVANASADVTVQTF